ncbi:MAG: formate dehydrogenase subunit delta [Nocardioidaceae bacterium]|nr:formate dehydrogenase subunit delta [Nocardioidaceae bacterium]NUS51230.1 formate dehydrogenase subunit delta [Nocardioidaceae bacterium]
MTEHSLEPPVVRLANDIARQFAYLPDDQAAAAIGKHLHSFWDPRMLRDLDAELERDETQLDPLVVLAVRKPVP